MQLTDQTRILVTIVIVALLIYFLCKDHNVSKQETFTDNNEDSRVNNMIDDESEEEGDLEHFADSAEEDIQEEDNMEEEQLENPMEEDEVANELEELPEEEIEEVKVPVKPKKAKKFSSKNKAEDGYKRSSYSGARRGNLGDSSWNEYYDDNNNLITNSQQNETDNFTPVDETNNNYASFANKGKTPCASGEDCKPEDLFDIDKMLPKEVNNDWFDVQPEPISVKNRHLINVRRPFGVDTIGTSLKGASHDLRGSVACPKFTVSPWLQSSIEPDNNVKYGVFN